MLEAGQRLQHRYRILNRIGGGGMGTVYLAEDERLQGRRCAIKEMSPDALAPGDRDYSIEAFRQEAQLLAQLHHPGLTAVIDFLGESGNWYLVMDYVEGETLEKRLARQPEGRLSVEEALQVTRQVLDVLTYLHTHPSRIIFRDLKPSNVMCMPDGRVKLIDFGIARFFKPGKAQDTALMGTPGFAAPEQYGGMGQSDARTDIYSLGVLLHHMVTGFDPFTAVTPFPVPDPAVTMPAIPPRIAQVIRRATQLRPELRYGSVAEMERELFSPTSPFAHVTGTQVMLDPYAPESAPLTAVSPRVRSGSRAGILIGLGIALVLLFVCGVAGVAAISQGWIVLPALGQAGGATPVTREAVLDPTDTPAADVATLTPTVAPADNRRNADEPPTEAPTATATTAPVEVVATDPAPTQTPIPLRLAYVRGDVGRTDIYVADADGRNPVCVACSGCDEAEPAWAPDGLTVAYQSNCEGSYDIWTAGITGGAPTRVTRTADRDEREPDWSPDGLRIAYRTSPQNVARNEDGELRLINRDGSGDQGLGIQGRSPTWSPDGSRLVFMSERDGSWQVYVYDLASRSTSKVTNCTANCRWPAWSPDGAMVVFHQTTGPGSVTADSIWAVSLNGGAPVRVVGGQHAGRPSWSAAGLVVFNSDDGIEVVTPQGQQRRTLISGNTHWAPVWSR